MRENAIDMTRGPIMPQLVRFGLPILLGMLFQRIYNFADVFIVGHFLGDAALAAVSISGVATYLLFSLMMGLTTGVSVVISQYFGAGDPEKVRTTFATSIYVAIGTTAIITVCGVLVARPLLRLLQTSDELMENAWIYLVILFGGSFSTMLYNWISSVLRSLGNSVMPLIFLIIASALNIVLDIAFIAWIPMGVAGAALATVLAQLISGSACLIYAMRRMPMLRITRRDMHPDRTIARQILTFGIPAALQMSIITISDMTLQGKVNTYGTPLVVAVGVCMKIEAVGWQLADAIGAALGTFVGQNVGAKNFDRVKKGVRCAYLLNLICFGVFCPAVWLLAGVIMRAFTQSPESVAYGVEYMRIFICFFLAGGALTVYHNILRAAGDVKVTLLMGVSEVITRIGFTFLFTAVAGYRGLWLVSPLTWCFAALVGAVRYYSGTWQKIAAKQAVSS